MSRSGKRGSAGGGRGKGAQGRQGARGPRGRGHGEPAEGYSGRKPQAQPGHQENTATGSHRHRHEGGPAAPRLGRRTALGQPTEQPPSRAPGPATGGPEATSATSPTPGATYRSFLVRPGPGPAPGDRRTPRGDGSLPKSQAAQPRATRTRSPTPVAAWHGSGRRAGSQRRPAPDGVPRAPAARGSLPNPLGRRARPSGILPQHGRGRRGPQ